MGDREDHKDKVKCTELNLGGILSTRLYRDGINAIRQMEFTQACDKFEAFIKLNEGDSTSLKLAQTYLAHIIVIGNAMIELSTVIDTDPIYRQLESSD